VSPPGYNVGGQLLDPLSCKLRRLNLNNWKLVLKFYPKRIFQHFNA
jgi:hypothetical protein